MSFIVSLALVALFRAVDLGVTRLCSPDLKDELNPIVRWLGWRKTIAFNAVGCVVVVLMGEVFIIAMCVISALSAMTWLFHKPKNKHLTMK